MKKVKIFLLSIFILIIFGSISYSQSPPIPVWTSQFSFGSSYVNFRGLCIGQNNKIFINGYTSTSPTYTRTAKFNEVNGSLEWQKSNSIATTSSVYFQQAILNNNGKVVSLIETSSSPKFFNFQRPKLWEFIR